MDTSAQTPAGFQRLHSGRHGLTREAVIASQRGRLLFGMAQAVADKGYTATTITDIAERASVSRRTFYEQFADKEDCFVAMYETGVEVLVTALAEASSQLGNADWHAVIRSDLETYLKVLVDDPAFAWAAHIEVFAAGAAAMEHRARAFVMFTERTRRLHEMARKQQPELPELPDEVFAVHTGGMDELVRECLRAHGAQALPSLAEPAVQASLALMGDTRR